MLLLIFSLCVETLCKLSSSYTEASFYFLCLYSIFVKNGLKVKDLSHSLNIVQLKHDFTGFENCILLIKKVLLNYHKWPLCDYLYTDMRKVVSVPWSENWVYSHSSHPQSWADVDLMCWWWCCCCYCCFQMWSPWLTVALVPLTSLICPYSQRLWSSWWIWTRQRERWRSGSAGPRLPCPPVCVWRGLLAWRWARRDRGHVHRPAIGWGRASSGCAEECSYPDSGSVDNSV